MKRGRVSCGLLVVACSGSREGPEFLSRPGNLGELRAGETAGVGAVMGVGISAGMGVGMGVSREEGMVEGLGEGLNAGS